MSNEVRPGSRERPNIDPVDLFDSSSGWRKAVVVALLLVAVLSILMPELVFRGNIFLVPDTKAPISFSEVGRKSLESGSYPLWNPYIFCGMPSFQSLSYTPYVYPVSFVTYILQRYLGFPEMTWLLIHYIMAGVGVYLLLRSFGARSSVSLLSGILFMIMPNLVANGANGHGSQACAVAYMPFAFLFCRKILSGRRRLANAALLAVVLGFQMLRGHVQISYYTYLLVGLLFLMESIYLCRIKKGKEIAVNFGFLAAAAVISVGIASVLVFPVREYADFSIRGGTDGGLDYGYATGWSLPPGELLTLVFPWAAGFGKWTYWGKMPFTDYPNYVGMVAAVYAIISMIVVRSRWKWYLAVIIIVSTLISFGRFFPVFYDPLFRFFPYFNKFRVPVMILIVQQLAFVVLMGMGIEEYLQRAAREDLPPALRKDRIRWVLIVSAALLLIAVAASKGIQQGLLGSGALRGRVNPSWIRMAVSAYSTDLVRTAFFFLAVVASVFYISWKKPKRGLVVIFIAVLLFLDIYSVDGSILHPEKTWKTNNAGIIRPASAKEAYKAPNRIAEYLSGDSSYFRIFPVPDARPGTWSHNSFPFSDNSFMISGIFSLGGYHAAKLKNYQDVMDVMFASFNRGVIPRQILNMLGVKYFVATHPVFPDRYSYSLVHEEENVYIYDNPEVLPRLFFVDRVRLMDRGEALSSLLSKLFDPSREVILQSMPALEIESAEGSSAEITDYDLNSITIKADIERSCIMVLSEIDYPDWKVYVDGEEREILTANYCLRAVALRAGDSSVVFRFESSVLKRSFQMSVVSFALALIALTASLILGGRKGG